MNSWFDMEIIVEGQHDLPPKEKWFYIITDDGYGFKARFLGRKVKKLNTFEDKEIIGRWVKGRLAELDFISGFEYVYQDKRRIGIITKEVLKSYGADKLVLKKTNKTKKDGRGTERDVWFLSF